MHVFQLLDQLFRWPGWSGVEALATVVATAAGIMTVVLTARGTISFTHVTDDEIDAMFDEDPSGADEPTEPPVGEHDGHGWRVKLAQLLVRLADHIRGGQ
ncbi:hypothetical protein [Bifidobacterium stellenboschense]|uniref:Uncharacterized protein n=1 Tax=Bifidobacterium stellenboschense TaxID=762211 RepID=A0A087DQQ0_9BIFI|nr:hypothetical protein [Bifidobacterium stellenboschense]KFI97850.1 hypothetical protein BSTEL_0661 [Bifidobacterium stellenboschense]